MRSLSDAPAAAKEDVIWIDPAEIERRHGVKLRHLQNLMNILEAVGLVSLVLTVFSIELLIFCFLSLYYSHLLIIR